MVRSIGIKLINGTMIYINLQYMDQFYLAMYCDEAERERVVNQDKELENLKEIMR